MTLHTENVFGKDTRHSEGLCEGVERWAPCDLPGGNVGVDKVQFVEELPHLEREMIECGQNPLRIPAQTRAAARESWSVISFNHTAKSAVRTCPASAPLQPRDPSLNTGGTLGQSAACILPTLLKMMDIKKRSSSSVSDRWRWSKVKKRTVKRMVMYW